MKEIISQSEMEWSRSFSGGWDSRRRLVGSHHWFHPVGQFLRGFFVVRYFRWAGGRRSSRSIPSRIRGGGGRWYLPNGRDRTFSLRSSTFELETAEGSGGAPIRSWLAWSRSLFLSLGIPFTIHTPLFHRIHEVFPSEFTIFSESVSL